MSSVLAETVSGDAQGKPSHHTHFSEGKVIGKLSLAGGTKDLTFNNA